MKKRLRKKLHKGEFTEYGFEVVFGYNLADDDYAAHEALVDDYLALIEGLGCVTGGGAGGRGRQVAEYYVTPRNVSGCTEEHRVAVRAWLEGDPRITGVYIGPLHDCWHNVRFDDAAEESHAIACGQGVRFV